MTLTTFEEDLFAALDRTWMDVHQIARATKVRRSAFNNKDVIRHESASGSGWETVLERLVESGLVEKREADPLTVALGKQYRRAL